MLLARWAIALPGWRFYGVIFAWEAGGMPTIWSNAICAPTPRILQGQALRDLASSAIDLSDGLISDLGHILQASNCGARIDLEALPDSEELWGHANDPEQKLRWMLSGGEDYELCFTVPELNRGALDVALGHLGVPFTCIGQMTADIEGIAFVRDGEPVTFDWKGYDHFATP
ncbi:thiamine monophosphate kinase [Salmonella enterica subsp. enterica]|nr:thiamine monophosphate kinase [Salmonella enterica subsp. enterica]